MESPILHYHIARIDLQLQDISRMVRDIHARPTGGPRLPIEDWLKLVLAGLLLWSALTGNLTLAELVKLWQ